MDCTPISKRTVKARFYSRRKKLTTIQTYVPINDAMDEEKDKSLIAIFKGHKKVPLICLSDFLKDQGHKHLLYLRQT